MGWKLLRTVFNLAWFCVSIEGISQSWGLNVSNSLSLSLLQPSPPPLFGCSISINHWSLADFGANQEIVSVGRSVLDLILTSFSWHIFKVGFYSLPFKCTVFKLCTVPASPQDFLAPLIKLQKCYVRVRWVNIPFLSMFWHSKISKQSGGLWQMDTSTGNQIATSRWLL